MNLLKTISFIIPTYKQDKLINKDVNNIKKSLESLRLNYEIIIVADGRLKEVKKAIITKSKNVKIIGYEENQGKGFAVKYGMLYAKGDAIGFIDAGMDLDPTEIPLMVKIMNDNNADMVVGSKIHPNSKVTYPLFRKILSFGYRAISHILFGFKIRDTQVGLKLFKKRVGKDIFSRITIKRFAFDIEVFVLASKLGYNRIYEAPVKLKFKQNTINPSTLLKTIFWMLYDTVTIFYRFRIIHYYDKNR